MCYNVISFWLTSYSFVVPPPLHWCTGAGKLASVLLNIRDLWWGGAPIGRQGNEVVDFRISSNIFATEISVDFEERRSCKMHLKVVPCLEVRCLRAKIFDHFLCQFRWFLDPSDQNELYHPPMTIQNMRFKQKLVDGPFNPVNIINIPQRLICSISPKLKRKKFSALCHVEW